MLRSHARSITAADIDGDGDRIVGSTSGAVTVLGMKILTVWVVIAQQTITTNGLSVEPIFTIDIDGDGDIDVIAATEEQIKYLV